MTATEDWNEVDDRYKGSMLGASLKILHLAEDIFLQYEDGMIDSGHWEGWKNWCHNLRRIDCVNMVYAARKTEFSKDFCTFFETGSPDEQSSLMADILRDSSTT
jgi:hypothetical protein